MCSDFAEHGTLVTVPGKREVEETECSPRVVGVSRGRRDRMQAPICFVSGQLPSSIGFTSLQPPIHGRPKRRPYHSSRRQINSLLLPGSTETIPAYAPVLILPGLGNSSADYTALASRLVERGHAAVSVAPVARWKWSLNARGFLTADYWRGTLKPKQVLDWYFDCVDHGVQNLANTVGNLDSISIVGHSAGGWLGRAYLAERAPCEFSVSSFVTLGTPNQAPPKGQLDQTRGLLQYIERNCQLPDLDGKVVCVAGRGTIGKPLGKGSVGEYIAFLSYAAVCGDGNVDGDGVTPVAAACATNGKLVLCDDCDHSMLTSQRWYGADEAYQKWVRYLS